MARPTKHDDDEILDRAMQTLWERGWAHTSIRDLERALDLRAPSIYRRFGTKEGLGVAAVDHYVDRVVRRRVAKHLSGEGDPLDNITMFLERSVARSGDGGKLWGCLLTTTVLEASEPDAELAAALERGRAAIDAGLRRETDRAAALGRLADGVDPDAAAATLSLAMQGLMALARGGVSSTDLRRRARAVAATIGGGSPDVDPSRVAVT